MKNCNSSSAIWNKAPNKRDLEQGTKLGINAAPNGIDLQDYPAPSDIGECYRVIRETLRSLLTKQMSDIAKQLRDYGVEP